MNAFPQADRIQTLREELLRWRAPDDGPIATCSTGWPGLDALFPDGGIRRGSLVEWIGEAGEGAQALSLAVARGIAQEGGEIVVVDIAGTFFPPAAASLGLDFRSLVVVRPRNAQDGLWTLREALACPAVAVACACVERLPARAYRQLQLAAEEGGSVGLLVRPVAALRSPAWCDAAVRVGGVPTGGDGFQVRAEIVRSRDGQTGRSIELSFGDP